MRYGSTLFEYYGEFISRRKDPDVLVLFFFISEHADGERRGACADLKGPKDTSHRDLSDATVRFDLALGVRRRHAPKSC